MYQTPKRILNNAGSTFRMNGLLADTHSNGGARSHGDVWDGISNGLATGFGGDCIVPEVSTATQVPQLLVAASAGGDLATPVAYWFKRWPMRIRVGSTTASAVPATSGLKRYITQNQEARGVLRLGLGDVVAASHIILDQGGLVPITAAKNFEVHFDIANVTNGTILATRGFADIGVFGGAIGVSPAAVANAEAFYFKITGGKINLYSTDTTDTLISQTTLPTTGFVLSIIYDADKRLLTGCVDGVALGQTAYSLPAAVTDVEVGCRVCHLAAYTVATDDPLTVDIDGIIATQLSYGAAMSS
jgi:hypothetical protein